MTLPFENILVLEDEHARGGRLLPLTYTRSVIELRTGAMTGIERLQQLYPEAAIFLNTRASLAAVTKERYGVKVNQVPASGRTMIIPACEAVSDDPLLETEIVDEIPADIKSSVEAGEASIEPPEFSKASLWQLIHANAKCITRDAKYLHASSFERLDPELLRFVAVEHAEDLLVHKSARIDAGVVLDCSEGPIVVDEGARIMPHATIMGPVYIGKHSLIKAGAKIYGGTTIGPVCKIGGEVENSIFQGYSNKQHDGYVGHSVIGEWCNLGAGTNTSDLKNDYSAVRVTIEGEEFNTGSLFVGLMMGDHSKSAIGTQFNTGSTVGVSCNIFGEGFPPKSIPNFSWGGKNGLETYRYEKAIEVATAVMARRGRTMSSEEGAVLRRLFIEATAVNV